MPRTSKAGPNVRDAVLDAAESLLARTGYRKTTMEDVAREANIGKGTTYLYFPNKEEVFLGTIDRIVERLCVRLRARARAGGPVEVCLREMLVERVSYRVECVAHYPASLDELFASLRPRYLDRRSRYFAAERDVFVEALEAARARGEIGPADAPSMAAVMLEATNGLLPYALAPREIGAPADVAARAARIAEPLVRGLLHGVLTKKDRS